MARQKTNNFIEVFKIFFRSIKTYFLYLDQCGKYLVFPIIGQLISIFIIFACTYYFIVNIDNIRNLAGFLQSDKNLLITLFVILLPAFLVFIRAFYKYIIAFEALNILFFTVSPNKKVKQIDFVANDKVIERRLFGYIILMLLVTILLTIPPLIFIAPISWIFLCLSFQIFALEPDTSAIKAVFRSIELVKGNVIPTLILLILCYIATYWFMVNLFIWVFDKLSITHFFINLSIPFVELLPLKAYNEILSIVNTQIDSITIAKTFVESAVCFLVLGFTLPFRCCCFTELYKLLDSQKIKEFSKNTEEIVTRATGKKGKSN